jgi:hypothetical protein
MGGLNRRVPLWGERYPLIFIHQQAGRKARCVFNRFMGHLFSVTNVGVTEIDRGRHQARPTGCEALIEARHAKAAALACAIELGLWT